MFGLDKQKQEQKTKTRKRDKLMNFVWHYCDVKQSYKIWAEQITCVNIVNILCIPTVKITWL